MFMFMFMCVLVLVFVSNFIANKFSVKNANNDKTYVIISNGAYMKMDFNFRIKLYAYILLHQLAVSGVVKILTDHIAKNFMLAHNAQTCEYEYEYVFCKPKL